MLPMPTDLDIYRSAKLLVEQHGQDALIEAAMKADQLLERATWMAGGYGRGSVQRMSAWRARRVPGPQRQPDGIWEIVS